jgi:hypothetical protein
MKDTTASLHRSEIAPPSRRSSPLSSETLPDVIERARLRAEEIAAAGPKAAVILKALQDVAERDNQTRGADGKGFSRPDSAPAQALARKAALTAREAAFAARFLLHYRAQVYLSQQLDIFGDVRPVDLEPNCRGRAATNLSLSVAPPHIEEEEEAS